jgi:hypothetical protein
MDTALRRMALQSAAKVALGSLLLGCGGAIDGGQAAAADAAKDAPKNDGTTPAEDAAPTLACTGPVDVDAGGVGSQAFECCLGVEQALLGDASAFEVDAGAVTSDPSASNCCNAIVAHVDEVTADYSAAGQALSLCCSALQYPMGPACTPWGPPTPPAMPELA